MLKMNTQFGEMVITDENKTIASKALKDEINAKIKLEDSIKPEIEELEELINTEKPEE